MQAEPHPFGGFWMIEQIAVGGMAEVWRARAYGLAGFEKIVVIKKILPQLARDEEFIRLFIDEAKILTNLVHTNIVQVFELNQIDGVHYISLEHVTGLDLARLVSRAKPKGPFPVALALFVCCEMLKALAFAHTRLDDEGRPLNIVHCDISPQNVLVSNAGEVKLADFGIARCAFQSRALHDVVRGKYAYMSPEQVDGRPLDGRSDLFSLGIVLFELLTGRRLFKASNREETIGRVRKAEVPSLRAYRPELSDDCEAMVLRALALHPDGRFPDAALMLEEMGALMVREGHRATHADLAAFQRGVTGESIHNADPGAPPPPPRGVVVLAAEIAPPPRSMATPRATLASVFQEVAGLLNASNGTVWEAEDGSLTVVWWADDLAATVEAAVAATLASRDAVRRAGWRLSAGLAPGVVRLATGSDRPPDGWELAGPFYLARWMMNFSAHGGRPLLTEVAAKQVAARVSVNRLGRISILGNRYIHLYEMDG